MPDMNTIHNSDVYFNVIMQTSSEDGPVAQPSNQMRHGEVYISLNRIYLNSGNQSYKGDIQDIKSIETEMRRKLILIRFWNLDMVIACKEQSELLALRDVISLSRNYLSSRNYMFLGSSVVDGCKA